MNDAELFQALIDEENEARKPKAPGIGSRVLGGVEAVLGAPKNFVGGLVRDYVSGASGMKMPESATPGSMLRAGLGLSDGDEGYVGALGGRLIETAEDMALDPLTYGAFGLGGKAAKVAGAGFTGLAGVGAAQAAGSAVSRYREEGFTPKVAEDVFDSALQGAMMGAGAVHMAEPVVVRGRIKTEPMDLLQKRVEEYTKSGKTELRDMVLEEIGKREGAQQALDDNATRAEDELYQAAARKYPKLSGDRIREVMGRMARGEITPEIAEGLLSRKIREDVNSAQDPLPKTWTKGKRSKGEPMVDQEAVAAGQEEVLGGQPNPFAPEGALPGEPPVSTGEPIPVKSVLKSSPMSDTPPPASAGPSGGMEAQYGATLDSLRQSVDPKDINSIFGALERLEQVTAPQAPTAPPEQPGLLGVSTPAPRSVTILATGETGVAEQRFDRTSERTGGKAPASFKVTLPDGRVQYVNARGLKFGPEVPSANQPAPIDNSAIGGARPVEAVAPPLPGGEPGRVVGPQGLDPAAAGVPGDLAVPVPGAGASARLGEPAGNFRGVEDQFARTQATGDPLTELGKPSQTFADAETEALARLQGSTGHPNEPGYTPGNPMDRLEAANMREPLPRPRAEDVTGPVEAPTSKALSEAPTPVKGLEATPRQNEEIARDNARQEKRIQPKVETAPRDSRLSTLSNAELQARIQAQMAEGKSPVKDPYFAGLMEELRARKGQPTQVQTEARKPGELVRKAKNAGPEEVVKTKKVKPETPRGERAKNPEIGKTYVDVHGRTVELLGTDKATSGEHGTEVFTGRDTKTSKPIRIAKDALWEEAPPPKDLTERDLNPEMQPGPWLAEADPAAAAEAVKHPKMQFLLGIFKQLVDRARSAAPEVFDAEGGAEIYPTRVGGTAHGSNIRGYNDPNTKQVFVGLGQLAKNTVAAVKAGRMTESKAAQTMLYQMHQNAVHEVVHSIGKGGETHAGEVTFNEKAGMWERKAGPAKQGPAAPVSGVMPEDPIHPLLHGELQRNLSGKANPLLDRVLNEPAFAREIWEATKHAAETEGQLTKAAETAKSEKLALEEEEPVTPPEAAEKPKKEKGLDFEQVAKLKEAFKGAAESNHLSSKQISELWDAVAKNPGLVSKVQDIAKSPSLMAKIGEGWKMGLISGPSTWVVKGVTDAGEMGFRIGETAVAPFVDKLLGGPRTRFHGEASARIEGGLNKLSEATHTLGKDLAAAFTLGDEQIKPDRPIEFQIGKIGGTKGKVIRVPGRVLNAITDFFRTTEASGELMKLAFRESKKTGNPSAEVIYREALDPTLDKWGDLLKEANDQAAEQIFQTNNPGPFLQGLMRLRQRNPWLHAVVPFLEIPGNITKMIAQRSPLGLIKAAKAYREYSHAVKAERGPGEIAKLKGEATDAITRPLVGMTVMGIAAAAAKAGLMTDGGPTDQKKKNEKLQSGWQPYSFKVSLGKGEYMYIPYHRFEPAGSLLGLAADAAHASDSKDANEIFEKGLHSITENFANQSYMQSVADAMQFISDPKTAIKTYGTSMAGSLVPNIVRRAATAIDPTVRDVRPRGAKLTDLPDLMRRSVQAGIPGLSQALPAKISDTGEPIQRPGNMATRFALPVQHSYTNADTATLDKLGEIDFAPGVPGRSIRVQGQDIPLEREEYEAVAQANRKAINYVRDHYFNNQRFLALPPEQQKKYVAKIFDQLREQEKARVQASEAFRTRAKGVLNAR